MAYVVDEKGNAKTTLNVVVPTLYDLVAAGKDVITLTTGGVLIVDTWPMRPVSVPDLG